MNKILTGIFVLTIVGILGVSMVSAFGWGFVNDELTSEEREAMQNEMQTAIENQDFASWKSLMEKRIALMQASLTEENFANIIERHEGMSEMRELMQEAREIGDFSEVEAFREEMGINGKGLMQGFRNKEMNSERNCPCSE